MSLSPAAMPILREFAPRVHGSILRGGVRVPPESVPAPAAFHRSWIALGPCWLLGWICLSPLVPWMAPGGLPEGPRVTIPSSCRVAPALGLSGFSLDKG